MPSCAVITCRARSQVLNLTKGSVSFHRFPKDSVIRAQWIAATGRVDWIPTPQSTICSAHFTENNYDIKKSGKKYLLEGSIPCEKIVKIQSLTQESTLYDTTDTKSRKRDLSESTNNDDDLEIIKRLKAQDNEINVPSTSGTLTSKESSDEKSQFIESSCYTSNTTSPRLKQIITSKDAVIKRQRKQIKKIQAQNRRLKKKIFKMDDIIINDLEEKCLLRHKDLSTLKNANLQEDQNKPDPGTRKQEKSTEETAESESETETVSKSLTNKKLRMMLLMSQTKIRQRTLKIKRLQLQNRRMKLKLDKIEQLLRGMKSKFSNKNMQNLKKTEKAETIAQSNESASTSAVVENVENICIASAETAGDGIIKYEFIEEDDDEDYDRLN